ncbi:MAG: circularly permuted type 2 ATP-grasp protein [Campylobacterales bacterium]|nr:circularly permuted type 2 ATP-grasp protein [Campylobacterales bacterium]
MASLFEGYEALSRYDEMFDAAHQVRSHWQGVHRLLDSLGSEALRARQSDIDWRLEENGVTYNVYNDPEGLNRPWRLDPIPFIIDADEWRGIEAGLKQRALLLDLLLKDLYGAQRVLKEGVVPPEVIFGHSGFIRSAFGHIDSSVAALRIYAADMARGPDGKMWIINDRTQAPSGLGYAIENRLAMNGAMAELLGEVHIHRISGFLNAFGTMLRDLAPSRSDNPLHVLLSPGPYNETYFEHAYLSSFLGLTLVQGQDLLGKDGKIYLRSLGGLRRVDTMLRRVDDSFCDPLELRSDSRLGVAGLMHAVRERSIAMANPIGSGLLENAGLNPFMGATAKFFLGEELLLPQIATWWCGQRKERDFVLENLSTLIIKRIDRGEGKHTFIGAQLSQAERLQLRAMILEHPYRYTGQEQVTFSTTPALGEGGIVPRKAIIRSFGVRAEEGYAIMPGGLVRVGSQTDSLIVSGQSGGGSKDLWIAGTSESTQEHYIPPIVSTADHLEHIPSLRAENLFWLGRYLTRSIITARMIRTALKLSANLYRSEQRFSENAQSAINRALTHLTMTYPGFLDPLTQRQSLGEIRSVATDARRLGSLAHTLTMLSNANAGVKNLLTLEGWRIFDRLERDFGLFSRAKNSSSRSLANGLEQLVTQLMAYRQLIEESLFEGLLLYRIGERIERGLLVVSKARALLCSALESQVQNEVLENMLLSCESLNAYRAHYKTVLRLENVIELMLLDIRFPKSLIYELSELQALLQRLPKSRDARYLSRYEESVFAAFSKLRLYHGTKTLEAVGDVRMEFDALLGEIGALLAACSNELGKTYFAHYDE